MGPGLNKAGKFPTVLGANEDIVQKIEDTKATVKFGLKAKKALCLGVAIANVGMKEDVRLELCACKLLTHDLQDIITNINLAVNFMVSLLPKTWQQVKRLYIKSTMGPPQRIFGF